MLVHILDVPTAQTNIAAHADASPAGIVPAWISVTLLFLIIGVMTTLKDVLVAHLKTIFALDYAQAMEIPFFFFASCFAAIPFGKATHHLGYRWAMVTGLCVTTLGCLLLLPAASVASFPLFLAALVVQGLGLMFLQVCTNPFVAALGSEATAASRLNLIQGFNAGGMALGPKIGSIFILAATPLGAEILRQMMGPALHAYQLQEAARVKVPYIVCALVMAILAVAIAVIRLPRRIATPDEESGDEPARFSDLWNYRNLVLATIGIFVYVGAEVSIGSFLVNYINRPEIGGISLKSAAGLVAFYWAGAMVGRFLGSAAQQRIAPTRVLAFNALGAALLVCVSMIAVGHIAMWTMIAVGLFNSIMFPTIFTLGIEGLGGLKAHASGVLAAACAGGAIIPELQGILADRIGIHHAFLLPVLCYLYIFWFASQMPRGDNLGAR